jgi:ABC-type dipeptide/oligopeptide/nickel transport system permease component
MLERAFPVTTKLALLTILFVIVYMITSLVTDLLYVVLDPRIRL